MANGTFNGGVFSTAALWTFVGVAIGIVLNPQIAGLLNPLLANLRISVAMQTS